MPEDTEITERHDEDAATEPDVERLRALTDVEITDLSALLAFLNSEVEYLDVVVEINNVEGQPFGVIRVDAEGSGLYVYEPYTNHGWQDHAEDRRQREAQA